MLGRLDLVGVRTFSVGRSILHGGGDAPDVIHQEFMWCFQLESLHLSVIIRSLAAEGRQGTVLSVVLWTGVGIGQPQDMS